MRRGLVLGFSCLAVILCVCFLFSLVCGVIFSLDILGADLLTVAIFCDIQMLCSACKAELKAPLCAELVDKGVRPSQKEAARQPEEATAE